MKNRTISFDLKGAISFCHLPLTKEFMFVWQVIDQPAMSLRLTLTLACDVKDTECFGDWMWVVNLIHSTCTWCTQLTFAQAGHCWPTKCFPYAVLTTSINAMCMKACRTLHMTVTCTFIILKDFTWYYTRTNLTKLHAILQWQNIHQVPLHSFPERQVNTNEL